MRCTSARQNAKNWGNYIDKQDISSLSQDLEIQHNLRSERNYRGKRFWHFAEVHTNVVSFLFLNGNPPMMYCHNKAHLFHGRNMLESMSQRWTNSIETAVFDSEQTLQALFLLGMFGKRLRTLTFRCFPGRDIIFAVSLYCRNLRHLTMRLDIYTWVEGMGENRRLFGISRAQNV